EATFLLGRHHLDQNQPLAAALCFERLRSGAPTADRLEPALSLELASCWLRSGKPEQAKTVLVRVKRAHPGMEIPTHGKTIKLFTNDASALAWMEEQFGPQRPSRFLESQRWAMFRGDESRNAPSGGTQPLLNVRWRQRTTDDRTVERFVTKVRSDYQS